MHVRKILFALLIWKVAQCEELLYNVKLFGINIGTQKILTKEEKGKVIIIQETKTNKFFSKFYKLDEYIETKVSKDFLPIEIFERIDEKDLKREILSILDQAKLEAIVKEGEKKETIKLPAKTFNIPSLIYYLRNIELKPEKREVYLIKRGKVEKILLDIGETEGIGLHKAARKVIAENVAVWFTLENLPIIIEVKLKAGFTLKGYLKK